MVHNYPIKSLKSDLEAVWIYHRNVMRYVTDDNFSSFNLKSVTDYNLLVICPALLSCISISV